MAFEKMTEIGMSDPANGMARPNGLRSFFKKMVVSNVGISPWVLIDAGLPDTGFHLQLPASATTAIQAQIEVTYDDPNVIILGLATPILAIWPNGKITGSTSVVTDSQWAGKCVRAWRLNVLVNVNSLPVLALANV